MMTIPGEATEEEMQVVMAEVGEISLANDPQEFTRKWKGGAWQWGNIRHDTQNASDGV